LKRHTKFVNYTVVVHYQMKAIIILHSTMGFSQHLIL